MRMWKKNLKLKKRSTASGLLEEKLFMLQDHFHDALKKHRKYMNDMSTLKFIDTCAKSPESLKIAAFELAQTTKREECKAKIEAFS